MSKCRLVKKNSLIRNDRANKKCRTGSNRLTMAFYVFIVCLVVGAGVYYLGTLNKKAQIGFETAELEAKLNDLKEDNKNLEVAALELQQVVRVQEEAGKLGMVATGKVNYLTIKANDLARR